jgi:K+-transporting ATPase ATPase A chain
VTTHAWLPLAVYLLVLLLAAAPLGDCLAAVMDGRQTLASRCGGGIESLLYRLCGVTRR